MFKILTLIIITCGMYPHMVYSQIKKWTLTECIEYGIKNNTKIKQREINIKMNQYEKRISIFSLFPTLSLDNTFYRYGGRVLDPTTYNYVEGEDVAYNYISAQLSITMNDVYKNIQQIKIDNLNIEKAFYEYQMTHNDIKLQIIAAYLELTNSKEAIEDATAVIKDLEIKLENLTNRKSVQKAVDADIISLKFQIADIQKKNVDLEKQCIINKIKLCQLINNPNYEDFDIMPMDVSMNHTNLNTYTCFDDVEFWPEIKSAKLKVKIAEKELKRNAFINYPVITLSYGVTTSYSSARRKYVNEDPITVQKYPLSEQFRDNKQKFISLNFKFPINSILLGQKERKIQKINVEKALFELEETRKEISKEISHAYYDWKSAEKQFEIAGQQLEYSRELYKQMLSKYGIGKLNTMEFKIAYNDYMKCKSDFRQAKLALIFKSIIMEFISDICTQKSIEKKT